MYPPPTCLLETVCRYCNMAAPWQRETANTSFHFLAVRKTSCLHSQSSLSIIHCLPIRPRAPMRLTIHFCKLGSKSFSSSHYFSSSKKCNACKTFIIKSKTKLSATVVFKNHTWIRVFSLRRFFSYNFKKIAWAISVCCGVDVRPNLSKSISNHS